jgi:hypothetical protein
LPWIERPPRTTMASVEEHIHECCLLWPGCLLLLFLLPFLNFQLAHTTPTATMMKGGPGALLLLVLALLLAMAEGYFLPGGAEVSFGLCLAAWLACRRTRNAYART